jgi:cell division protein FtsB
MARVKQKDGKNISQYLVTFLSFGLCMYFTFHLLHGTMGYFALRGVNEKLSLTQNKFDKLLLERTALENRVKLLRPASLDLDMLDERARVVLGFAKPDERVVLEGTRPEKYIQEKHPSEK